MSPRLRDSTRLEELLAGNKIFALTDKQLLHLDGSYVCYRALCRLNEKLEKLAGHFYGPGWEDK